MAVTCGCLSQLFFRSAHRHWISSLLSVLLCIKQKRQAIENNEKKTTFKSLGHTRVVGDFILLIPSGLTDTCIALHLANPTGLCKKQVLKREQ